MKIKKDLKTFEKEDYKLFISSIKNKDKFKKLKSKLI